jgi:antagonist of KipI
MVTQVEVLSPGLLTTVQDLGRYGQGHLGVSACGAADALALRLGNLLAGNAANAPALEFTLRGGRFRFDAPACCVLTGAEFECTLDGVTAPAWTALSIRAGQTLAVGGAKSGARAYLCFRGGLDVARVMGSCATHVPSALGGIEGRALRAGDVLRIGDVVRTAARRRIRPEILAKLRPAQAALRVTSAAQTANFSMESLDALYALPWSVQSDSSRMGVRLTGRPLAAPADGRMTTEGAPLGAIQVTPSGEPVILFVDHQTTGGYPKIGCVAAVDHWRVGQLRPRETVRFEHVSFDSARRLMAEREALMRPEVLFAR